MTEMPRGIETVSEKINHSLYKEFNQTEEINDILEVIDARINEEQNQCTNDMNARNKNKQKSDKKGGDKRAHNIKRIVGIKKKKRRKRKRHKKTKKNKKKESKEPKTTKLDLFRDHTKKLSLLTASDRDKRAYSTVVCS
eukprot:736616_1